MKYELRKGSTYNRKYDDSRCFFCKQRRRYQKSMKPYQNFKLINWNQIKLEIMNPLKPNQRWIIKVNQLKLIEIRNEDQIFQTQIQDNNHKQWLSTKPWASEIEYSWENKRRRFHLKLVCYHCHILWFIGRERKFSKGMRSEVNEWKRHGDVKYGVCWTKR